MNILGYLMTGPYLGLNPKDNSKCIFLFVGDMHLHAQALNILDTVRSAVMTNDNMPILHSILYVSHKQMQQCGCGYK